MKIKKILSQHRRDFTALMECEHCGHEWTNKRGYDDANYHNNVIRTMVCKSCGKASGEDYRPLAPKYPDHQQV